MSHLTFPNVALITARRIREQRTGYFFCSEQPANKVTLSSRDDCYVLPLYAYPDNETATHMEFRDTREANLSQKFIDEFSEKLGLEFVEDGQGDLQKDFGAEDVFHYAYAVFHCPTYRQRYEEFLKIDFPRLPLTSDVGLFRDLVAYGHTLVRYHLMKEPGEPTVGADPNRPDAEDPAPRHLFEEVDWTLRTTFEKQGDNEVETRRYAEPHEEGGQQIPGRVYINDQQYFEGIAPPTWEFHIGGYQVLDKWLKDRKGRTLSWEDIQHYQKIVIALEETQRLMALIDERIESWPIE